jgi:hypothetical protein
VTDASFLGFIEANLLLVTQVYEGEIVLGYSLYGGDVLPGTIITAFGTGSGGAGSYEVSISQTASGPNFFQYSAPSGTGPPYPPPPGAGSNSIGQFQIGISSIGDIAPFNIWATVESQYANSPRLTTLILDMDAWIDQTENFDNLYDDIWNIVTAQGYGLDVWGRIVGVVRTLTLEVGNWFGFAEASPTSFTFGQGSFYSGVPITSNYVLSDSAFRTLIYAKAASNISDGSIPSINSILMMLFPHRGNAYVQDGQPTAPYFGFAEASANGFNQAPFYGGQLYTGMTMTYVFDFPLQPFELAIVQQSGVLPKPVGVKATVLQI